MSGSVVSWGALLLFVFLFAGSVIAEAQWLRQKGWTTFGRAIGCVITTDLVSFCIGGALVFVAFFVMFMMVMGPAGRGGTSPEWAYWLVTAIAIILSTVILFFTKRLFLRIFKIGSGTSAWLYSLIGTLLIIFVVIIPPPLLLYLIVTLWK